MPKSVNLKSNNLANKGLFKVEKLTNIIKGHFFSVHNSTILAPPIGPTKF